jgi:hypothetical protein
MVVKEPGIATGEDSPDIRVLDDDGRFGRSTRADQVAWPPDICGCEVEQSADNEPGLIAG